ncbi:kinesin-like protein [Roridomyces roridus]|uniref:Kinesin-like protein n=1 Tax=Roridomyces roridus TaxID=1738132 RepID=A0AAD7BYJ9_9AGAR|nr:kinesin-like protein [Roridomyces roridus]
MAASKVKIVARLRPRLPGEASDDAIRVCHSEPTAVLAESSVNLSRANTTVNNSSSLGSAADSSGNRSGMGGGSFTGIAVNNPRDVTQVFRFPFTSCYDADATQQSIFETDVLPLIDVALGGVTVTIFAYGVTSSGKTHTMQGTPKDPGVIPRVVEALFAKNAASDSAEAAQVTVSYIEIYKDDVYDLLVARENAPKLPVRENDNGMVFVAGLVSSPITSVTDFQTLYDTATARRSVGATLLNRASSRSHAVLTLNIRRVTTEGDRTTVREGKINLVDLAGSENNKLTGNDPSRMAESSAINKSLSVLGQVVHALNIGATRIPYRNAKLTRILQDALGGRSVGLLICNLAPGTKFRQDTLNTLNFAVRTKNIENRPVVNERDIRPPPTAAASAAPALPRIDLAATSQALALKPRPGMRPSLVPRAAPRPSGLGIGGGHRMSVVGTEAAAFVQREKEKVPPGLSEAEIDARISRAVEAEVARRMEEKEKEMAAEREKEREREREAGSSRHRTKSPRHERSPKSKERELPPGLSPLLKRNKDLEDGLQVKLQELERRLERGNREVALPDVLSPVSKKKAGRAYVALARTHSDRGDLQAALDLYRQAETYVPDNIKLKERIIEIEWAVKNGKSFKPSPKKAKKGKERREKRVEDMDVDGPAAHVMSDDQMEVDEVATSLTGRLAGHELTNTGSKRSLLVDDDEMETPAKRPKRGEAGAKKIKKRVVTIESDEEEEEEEDFDPDVAPRKNRRRVAA